MAMSDGFHMAAMMVALDKVFKKDDRFDVCTVRECFEMGGVDCPSEDMNAFRILHCVKYADMPQGMRDELFNRVLTVIQTGSRFSFDTQPALASLIESKLGSVSHAKLIGDRQQP